LCLGRFCRGRSGSTTPKRDRCEHKEAGDGQVASSDKIDNGRCQCNCFSEAELERRT
jgi:hypothetical protein